MRAFAPNTLSVHWRIALGAAHDALDAAATCPGIRVVPAETHERAVRLVHERDAVQQLLEQDARAERMPLTRRLVFPSVRRAELGLPADVEACVFELDGVLTPSADLHYTAWATVLDDFLVAHFARASVHLGHLARLSRRADYEQHLHGQPRVEGLRAFLASRGLTLPDGTPRDAPGTETIYGLANAKNHALRALLARQGIEAYAGSARYMEALAGSGLGCVVVSASANADAILDRAELTDLVDVLIDGAAMTQLGLRAKPAADLIVAACERLDLPPQHVASFETTAAGVAAAHAAGIGFVVFVARDEGAAPAAADCTVTDPGELLGTLRVSA
jgi:HAD superfamily hydrolase (TIGR01509 family)